MLELPECRTLSAQMNDALRGRRITGVVAAHSPHRFAWFHGEPEDYPPLLEGRRLERAESFGGFVELHAEGARLTFQDGVNLRRCAPEEKRPPRHQLLLELDDGAALVASVQMYGGLLARREEDRTLEDNRYYRAARDLPDPLGDAFTPAHFERLLRDAEKGDKLSAKAFLATQQRIPGLGNGVLQDILFAAGIHPKRRMATLGDAGMAALYDAVRGTLAEMTRLGGRDTEKDLHGQPGGYRTRMSKLALDRPCPVCNGGVRKMAYLGGSVYLCEHCQPL